VRLFGVAIQCVSNLGDEKLREGLTLWLNELESFSKIPLYFTHFLQNKKSQELLFSALTYSKDAPINYATITEELKEAVQQNYKILQQVFSSSQSVAVRESAIKYGFITRILERLGAISGEKARVFEEILPVVEEEKIMDVPVLAKKDSYDPNVT